MAIGDRSKSFIQSVLGKITDPGQRQAAETVFSNAAVLAEFDNGVAGQSEIDRQLQDLKAKTDAANELKAQQDEREGKIQKWHDDLTGWRQQNVEFVELGVAAKKAGWKPGDPPPKPAGGGGGDPKLPENVVTADTLKTALGEFESSLLGYDTEKTQLMKQHHDTFGQFLDVTPLIKHPQIRELGLVGVYNLVHKDALAAKATEVQAARDKKIADEAVSKYQAAQSTLLPYPITSQGPGSGSPLDGLNVKPDANAGSLVERASAEYNRLQQARPS